MKRRTFLGQGLMLVGFGRRVWAQLREAVPTFFPLTRPVLIPLDAVRISWQPVAFTAEARAPATATAGARRVLISGVLFRRSASRDSAIDGLSALCVTCPHEQCKVDLVTDHTRLAAMTGAPSNRPLFECGCHFSLFDAAQEGTKIAGETPRGLYRFRVAGVNRGMVEITDIEEVALLEV